MPKRINATLNIKWNRDIVGAIVLSVLGSSVALAMFFLSGYMITQSALGAPLFALMGLIVSVKLFGFTRAITRYYERLLSHRATFTMLKDVRVHFYQSLIPIVPNVFRQFKTSDLLGRMVSQIESLQNIYLRVYYPPIVIGLTSVLTVLAVTFFSIWHALIIVIVVILSLWIVPWLSVKRARMIKRKLDTNYTRLMHQYFDYVLGYEELKRFNQVHSYENLLLESESDLSETEHKEQLFHIFYQFTLNLISMFAIFLTVAFITIQVQQGKFDPILATSTVLMLLTLFEQHVMMSQVAYYKSETDQAKQQLESVMKMDSLSEGKQKVDVSKIKSQEVLFELKHVGHRFPTQQRDTLKEIHLEIKKGEHIAILGASGSGKSTLLNVLMGVYPVSEGSFEIGGVSDFHRSHWLTQINPLIQEAQFFDGTVRENLLTSHSDEACLEALQRVGLENIPLSRAVTLNRTALSGGEFQRLAIARLWLKQAPVWILDEPTRGIDRQRVSDIMKQIHRSAETLIVATHDLEILEAFDTVYVMVDGQLKPYITDEID
ncbi:amino acid ABC transporter ATP-binding/permease protein [Staphylococcus ratti]|uniref:Amino acid ABC transporter ATP-binding/permease protein n=1 Tax=Staphylococcus ratti TaxID=2892440 RepID=A0ABY3PBX6_9STAP|nr:amino acid ABC transporter ATP-binding/permease protein [Staphylococcus ratti]UEX89801.1 amino acid ABC transporter ATP-binding/permease protein [Staphylococcus ratti]